MAKTKSNPTATATKAFNPMEVLRTEQRTPDSLNLIEKFRGRSAPVAEEDVLAMAESLYARQDQPIQIRENGDVIFGNTRTRAGMLITQGFQVPTGKDKEGNPKFKVFPPVPDFTLRAEVVDCDDEEATLRNITENISRVATTSIDDAQNQEMLREEFKMSDAALTRLYGYGHQASVTQLKKLLSLPEEIQQKIHTGNMTKHAGFVLVDWCRKRAHVENGTNACNPAVCEAVLAGVTGGEDIGNVGSSAVQEAIKAYEKAQAADTSNVPVDPSAPETTPATGETGTTPAGGTSRGPNNEPAVPVTVYPKSLKDVKDMLMEFAGLPDQPAKMVEFCTTTLNFIKGEVEKDAYYEWLSSAFTS